eukprot:67192_1
MCIVYYLPCIWSIVCVLCTLNFIRNRNFLTKIFRCNCFRKSDEHNTNQPHSQCQNETDPDENKADASHETNTITGTTGGGNTDTDVVTSNDQKRMSKSGTGSMMIHMDIDENKAYSHVYEFALGILHDTNAEDISEDEEDEEDAYHINETGTARIYPTALTREPTDLELNSMDHMDVSIKPMDLTLDVSISRSLDPSAIEAQLSDTQQSPSLSPNQHGSKKTNNRRNMLVNAKAKSQGTSTAFAKSHNVKHLVPVKTQTQPSHRRVQSERPHSLAEEPQRPDTQRSPSVTAGPIGRPSIEGHMGNSDPIKGSTQWQQRNSERHSQHIKSRSFQTGDGNRKAESRRTLSRRLVFSKLPRQMQILPEVDKHKVEEFANLNHMMTLHGFCEKNQFFQFEVHEMGP